jgi:Carbohydrate family 9 binding domain-like
MGYRHGLRKMVSAAALLGLTLQVAACVGGSKGLSADDKEKLKAYVLDAPPADAKKLDINFENKVRLVGYKFEPELAKPGESVKLTYYWKAEDTVEDGWLLFTHLRDDVSDKSDNMDWSGPLRENKNNKQILGPDRWEKGKVYADEQPYKMPDWVTGPELTVMVGVWKNDARLRIVAGANDGDNRAVVGKIKTGVVPVAPVEKPHTDIPQITANKLAVNEKIVVDGKADDAAWRSASSTGPFVDVATGKPNSAFPVTGSAKLTWDDSNLYVLIEVTDPEVVGGFDAAKKGDDFTVTGQPKLWTKDTVEIMTDPDGDGDNKDYYELQINPQNKVFHSQFDTYNGPKTEPNGPFGHEDWDPKLKSAVSVRGTLDKEGDKDEGYTVEMAIPWSAYSKAANHPPKNGDSWRMNFYAMKNNSGTAWSPILGQGNFHKATRFGKVTWAVPGAASPPAPVALAASAVPAGPEARAAAPAASAAMRRFLRPHGKIELQVDPK